MSWFELVDQIWFEKYRQSYFSISTEKMLTELRNISTFISLFLQFSRQFVLWKKNSFWRSMTLLEKELYMNLWWLFRPVSRA